MAVTIGINGFGRIGRYLTRLLADDPDITLTAINARADNAQLAHLLKYDSVHGRFAGTVVPCDEGLMINDRLVRITRHGGGDWRWADCGCQFVIETTGKFVDRESCEKHLASGAQKVIISAPGKNEDVTVVMGVNDHELAPEHRIISNASCTTNCLAPIAKALNDAFGIRHGLMTTIHSYTMSQRILDGSHKDWRRGRACALSMIPTTTGAARAVTKVIPALTGKLDGMSIRVPTPNVSVVDFTCELDKPTDTAGMLAVLQAAAGDNLGFTDEPLVSIDFVGDTHGGVVDAKASQVLDGTMAKVLAWYDNEAGFTNQLVRLIKKAAAF
ncbi:glyceraldehyde-3-phosphate dehydrogenase, type I [Solidesulfovibrio carbinoliphilus subsp. oakridgensis]|uniref:Glyceraldehyde-3-phosphate dehydrogenase n=1 Tax=Solidesulfovibrio carbinoliphilus subsp. oakridgensis TaxID=694327 RepID=G7Q4X1_9BACT|nr:type I glyceraldehyde-3-phosphate dehydrogenase [Solidesulfovibrio carbinoliphilus]EHJ47898.1 glyceraldehyde-3-phosphate dehydrogenase, type I [Solidesulfovibrio carbinoliphilus subsp. oakridgensis]